MDSENKLSAPNQSSANEANAQPVPKSWLTLREASDVLGVHYTTLRVWADKGDIPVFRTPGGHRRFSAEDLRRFLDQRVEQSTYTDTTEIVDAAVDRVREEMQRFPVYEGHWSGAQDEMTRAVQRQRGRELFALAIAFVLKPAQHERLLNEGRQLGFAYGKEASGSAMSLVEAGRAVQFFRNQLALALQHNARSEGLDADDVRIQQALNRFLDEVLYAVLDGYEKGVVEA
jgi:excisionase family DNA binding protein